MGMRFVQCMRTPTWEPARSRARRRRATHDEIVLALLDVSSSLTLDGDRRSPRVVAWTEHLVPEVEAGPMESNPGPRFALVAGTFTATEIITQAPTSLTFNANRRGHFAHGVGHGERAGGGGARSASRAVAEVTTMTQAPGTSSLRWCADWIRRRRGGQKYRRTSDRAPGDPSTCRRIW